MFAYAFMSSQNVLAFPKTLWVILDGSCLEQCTSLPSNKTAEASNCCFKLFPNQKREHLYNAFSNTGKKFVVHRIQTFTFFAPVSQ